MDLEDAKSEELDQIEDEEDEVEQFNSENIQKARYEELQDSNSDYLSDEI